MPDPLDTYFGPPPVKISALNIWPPFKTIPIGWSHSVIKSQAISHEVLFTEAGLDPKYEINTGNPRAGLRFRFCVYIDDILVLGTDLRKVIQFQNRVKMPSSEKSYCQNLLSVSSRHNSLQLLNFIQIVPSSRARISWDLLYWQLHICSALKFETCITCNKYSDHEIGFDVGQHLMSVLQVCYYITS